MLKHRRGPASAMAALVLPLLLSCGGGGGSGGSEAPLEGPQIGANYFPLDDNARWIYKSDAAPGARVVASVAGLQAVGGATGVAIDTIDPTDGAVHRMIYVVTGSAVFEYAPPGADALTRALSDIELMRLPPRVGESFLQLDRTVDLGLELDLDGDGRADRMAVRGTSTVEAIETVSTPAGAFSSSVRVRQKMRQTYMGSTGAKVALDATIDTWYAPDVGPVKRVLRIVVEGMSETTTDVLTAYRVGDRRSDQTAPQLVSSVPGAQPVRGLGAVVGVSLSEVVDPASVTVDSLVVRDAAGVRVAGTVRAQDAVLRFEPAAAWSSGRYHATLAAGGVSDFVGNPIATAYEWQFEIDATAPGIVRMIPDGLKDLEPLAPIVIELSEAPRPASFMPANVTLSKESNLQDVPIQVVLEGTRLTVTPLQALQIGAAYRLIIRGLEDTLGNRMPDAWLTPLVTQGRFAWPVPLFPQGRTTAMALGDVDGDGRNDILFAAETFEDFVYRNRLYIMAGRADGSLGSPLPVDIGSQLHCRIDTIALGDLNADGRVDVVAGADYCGAQVLHQTAQGTLSPGQFLPWAATRVVRIVDVDGDGRPDLVGAGGSAETVSVWTQDAAGSFALSNQVPAGGTVIDVDVGDLNQDGRPDLVAAVAGFSEQQVSIMLQEPDGSFAAPVLRATIDAVWSARAVAVGDLNGDGRDDVATTVGGNSPYARVVVYYQTADGILGEPVLIPTYDIPAGARVADVDGDGRTDLVVAHSGWLAVSVYLQRPDGTLAPEERYAAPYGGDQPGALAVGDVNADGWVDILVDGDLILQRPNGATAGTLSGGAPRATTLLSNRAGLKAVFSRVMRNAAMASRPR